MNDRMQELADNAREIARLKGPYPNWPFEEDLEFEKAFGRLIVEECANIALWQQGMDTDVSIAIKDHFGIK